MTKEEAIAILSHDKEQIDYPHGAYGIALDMAIKALQEEKVGHWDKVFVPLPLSDGTKECYQCSSCGTHWEHTSKYCPYCRAIMGSEEEG